MGSYCQANVAPLSMAICLPVRRTQLYSQKVLYSLENTAACNRHVIVSKAEQGFLPRVEEEVVH